MLAMENKFACPSGCMGPETCAYTTQIRDLADVSRDSTPTAEQYERILYGELTHEQARQEADYTARVALLGSCTRFALSHQQQTS